MNRDSAGCVYAAGWQLLWGEHEDSCQAKARVSLAFLVWPLLFKMCFPCLSAYFQIS